MSRQDPRYAKRWKYERDNGIQRTAAAATVADHIDVLIAAGWSVKAIAEAAGRRVTTVQHIANREYCRTNRMIARAILAVRVDGLYDRTEETAFVPRVGAVRRVQALLAMGHRHADISAAMKRHGANQLSKLVLSAEGDLLMRRTHDAVSAAFDDLSMTPGPSRETARRAAKLGYVPPLAWDDDTIDDPAAVPQHDLRGGPWELQPCGTHAAARRHHRHGEKLCDACSNAERRRNTERAA